MSTFPFLLVQNVHLMVFASFSEGTMGNRRTGDKKIPVCWEFPNPFLALAVHHVRWQSLQVITYHGHNTSRKVRKYFPFCTDEELRGNVDIKGSLQLNREFNKVQGKRAFIQRPLKSLSSLLLLILFGSFQLGVWPAFHFLYRLPFYYFPEIKSFASNGGPWTPSERTSTAELLVDCQISGSLNEYLHEVLNLVPKQEKWKKGDCQSGEFVHSCKLTIKSNVRYA